MRDEDISVILVDENDNIVGYGDKLDVHRKGLLHRSFSVLIFNEKGELLLQQRSQEKYHAPGLWVSTCCGHPFPGENVQEGAIRRVKEELGFVTDLTPLTHIYYKKSVGLGMIEHEYAHVFKGSYNGQKIHPDPQEVSSYDWKAPDQIQKDIKSFPQKYAPWFRHYMEEHSEVLFGHLDADVKG